MSTQSASSPRLRMPSGGGSRLGLSAVAYTGGVILQRAFAILLLPVLTRILSVDEFGLAGTSVSVGALLAVVFGFGLSFTIVRLYYDEPDAERATWAALVRVQAAASLVVALIAYATGPLWATVLGDVPWGAALQLAVLSGWLMGVQQTVLGLLRAAHRPIAFVCLTSIQVVAGGVAGVLLATRFGAPGYVGGVAFGTAASLVPGVVLTLRRPRWDRAAIGAGIRLSLPAMAHQMSSWGIELADRLLVVAVLGLTAAGKYQIAYTVGSALVLLLTGAQMAWSPSYMSRSARSRRRLPTTLVVPTSAVAFAGTLGVVLLAPALLAVFAPADYRTAQVLLAFVAAAAMPRAAYFVLVVALVDQKKTGRMAIATGSGVIVNVALNLALLHWIGLIGAGIANLASTTIMALMVVYATETALKRALPVVPMLLVWATGTAALLGASQIPTDPLGWGCRGALLLVAAAGGLFGLRHLRTVLASAP